MTIKQLYPQADKFLAATHEVTNQPPPLENYNLFSQDGALQDAIRRYHAASNEQELHEFGGMAGRQEYLQLGQDANHYKPEFNTHDRFGHRVDEVKFHPAYHRLMGSSIHHGLHASPWISNNPNAHLVRTAKCYMQTQVEAAHGCPITMTFAAVPVLRAQPSLASVWEPKILSTRYDPSNQPISEKHGATIGMGMTEKQGGSDVRSNSTRAHFLCREGDDFLYEIVGHKFFLSAPMCDAFLVLAQAEKGLSCFLVPRWRMDGSKNPLEVQRLKNKMGNVANASSEVEFRGATGYRIGEEGRGVATIIEMVALTRFDCMMGSSAGMRMAVSQALHHCSHRRAFGKLLIDQPLMQNVLADLCLEAEGALAFTMRLAHALDSDDEAEQALVRLATAIGKYWICKRTPQVASEAMECIGGSGVMEDSMMPRLYREAPVNSIWEGSGNIQCLDVLRAIQKSPAVLEVYFAELTRACGADKVFDQYIARLKQDFSRPDAIECRARSLVDRMAIAMQGSLLLRQAPGYIAESYILSRMQWDGSVNIGTLPANLPYRNIIDRHWPKVVGISA